MWTFWQRVVLASTIGTLFVIMFATSSNASELTTEEYIQRYNKYQNVSYYYDNPKVSDSVGPVLLVHSSDIQVRRSLEKELCLITDKPNNSSLKLENCFNSEQNQNRQQFKLKFFEYNTLKDKNIITDTNPQNKYFQMQQKNLESNSGSKCLTLTPLTPDKKNSSFSFSMQDCVGIDGDTENGKFLSQLISLERKTDSTDYQQQYLYINSSNSNSKKYYLDFDDQKNIKAKTKNKKTPCFYFRDFLPIVYLSKKPQASIPIKAIENFYKSTEFSIDKTTKPNVILFFVDTLRADAINKNRTPNIWNFKKDSYSFTHSLSGATSTHHSMFSALNSRPAFEKDFFHKNNKSFDSKEDSWLAHGSLVSTVFEKLGYQVIMFSSPIYYDSLDEGRVTAKSQKEVYCKNNSDLASCSEYKKNWYRQAFSMKLFNEHEWLNTNKSATWISSEEIEKNTPDQVDKKVIDEFINIVNKTVDFDKGGYFMMIYLYGTHNPHIISKEAKNFLLENQRLLAPYFEVQNFSEQKNSDWGYSEFLKSVNSAADDSIKKKFINTYYNTASVIDIQIGRAIEALKDKKVYNNSYIIFMSDHGESLLENSKILHGGVPLKEQTEVPIYYKIPGSAPSSYTTWAASTLDIFPTIFDYLGVEQLDFFTGQSLKPIFTATVSNSFSQCLVSTAPYGPKRHPVQFVFYNPHSETKIRLRFSNKQTEDFGKSIPLSSEEVEVIAYTDYNDKPKEFKSEVIKKEFGNCFKHFLGNEGVTISAIASP